jgi:NO-binding membrane sensor protein with MHYT domain
MPQGRSPTHRAPPGRGRDLLLAVPAGVVAVVALWVGDAHLMQRDWLVGAVVFGIGLAATFVTVRQLRRAGVVR